MSLWVERFDNAERWTEFAAGLLEACIRAAVVRRGCALLALSGGGTPEPVYRRLAQRDLPWEKVTLTLTDERWVGAGSGASNERLVRDTLLAGKGAAARFVPLKNAASTAHDGAAACEEALAALPTPFDCVLLGMGEDGHTASLFPHSPGLERALERGGAHRCMPMTAPVPPAERMSFTLAMLLDSREIVLLIRGRAKWCAFERARQDTDAAIMPVRAVLHQREVPVRVVWSP